MLRKAPRCGRLAARRVLSGCGTWVAASAASWRASRGACDTCLRYVSVREAHRGDRQTGCGWDPCWCRCGLVRAAGLLHLPRGAGSSASAAAGRGTRATGARVFSGCVRGGLFFHEPCAWRWCACVVIRRPRRAGCCAMPTVSMDHRACGCFGRCSGIDSSSFLGHRGGRRGDVAWETATGAAAAPWYLVSWPAAGHRRQLRWQHVDSARGTSAAHVPRLVPALVVVPGPFCHAFSAGLNSSATLHFSASLSPRAPASPSPSLRLSASQDNFFDVAPPLLFFAGLVTFVQWKRHQILMEHRDWARTWRACGASLELTIRAFREPSWPPIGGTHLASSADTWDSAGCWLTQGSPAWR